MVFFPCRNEWVGMKTLVSINLQSPLYVDFLVKTGKICYSNKEYKSGFYGLNSSFFGRTKKK